METLRNIKKWLIESPRDSSGKLLLVLAGVGSLTIPATLAAPGERVEEYLFYAAILLLGTNLISSWWKWVGVVVAVALLCCAGGDHANGQRFLSDTYRARERFLLEPAGNINRGSGSHSIDNRVGVINDN